MTIEPGHHYHENLDEEAFVQAVRDANFDDGGRAQMEAFQRASQVPDPFAIRIPSVPNDIVFTVFDDGIAQMGLVDKDWYIGRQYKTGMGYQEEWTFIPSEVIAQVRLALDRVSKHII